MSTLTAENVDRLMRDCLYKRDELPVDGSSPPGVVIVEGVLARFGFHPQRLESHRAEVLAMLSELPMEFRTDGGGGWSFLQACARADGEQWGEHKDVEALLCLAIGLGLARWRLPREVWTDLPGGMPYVVLTLPKVGS